MEQETLQTEETQTQNFIEKDGEILIPAEPSSEEPSPSPGESEEQKTSTQTEKGQEEKGKSEEEKETTGQEEKSVPDTYEGKTLEDIIEMHRNASQKIAEQGRELGELRKKIAAIESPEDVKEKLSAQDLKQALIKERVKLEKLDPISEPEEYYKQQELLAQIEADYMEKLHQEAIQNRLNDADNRKFIQDKYRQLKELGMDIPENEYGELIEIAKNYLDNGRFNDEAIYKALIDKYGPGKIVKFFTKTGEQKARQDIRTAQGKVEPKVDISGSGKTPKYIKLAEMSPVQMERFLENLSLEEIKILKERLNKLK